MFTTDDDEYRIEKGGEARVGGFRGIRQMFRAFRRDGDCYVYCGSYHAPAGTDDDDLQSYISLSYDYDAAD